MSAWPQVQRNVLGASQAGLTLVELLVAMALTAVVGLAAVATLSMSRQGFGSLDGAAQLRDNARFASTLLQQAAAQAGYKDLYDATYGSTQTIARAQQSSPLFVEGADASSLSSSASYDPNDAINDSDVLVLRAMPSAKYELIEQRGSDTEGSDTQTVSDQGLGNCLGHATSSAPSSADDTIVSYFYVRQESGDAEPALYCGAYSDNGSFVTQSLIRGVETLQVLYGVNTSDNPNTLDEDSSFQLKNASQIRDPSQWRQVRSIRIGMVLRSSPLSMDTQADTELYPLGQAHADADGGRFLAPDDGRLRLVSTLTLGLRNAIDR